MDALLQIVVPKVSEIPGFRTYEPKYEWDGIEYPQGPPVLTGDTVELTIDDKTPFVYEDLPDRYILDDWVWLKASDENLDKYENWVNSDREATDRATFEEFLGRFLRDLDRWVVAFILHWDQVDNVYQLTVDDCVSKLRTNLVRENHTEGFVAYC